MSLREVVVVEARWVLSGCSPLFTVAHPTSCNQDLETTLLYFRIKPKLKEIGQELTEILYPLLIPWMYSDRVIEEEQESAELSSKRDL